MVCLWLFSQVNGVNVVKVGHKQVVSLIRQSGNSLLMKVVSVTRKPESEESVRKKGKGCVLIQQNWLYVCFAVNMWAQLYFLST